MALSFGNAKGSAQKGNLNQYSYKMGENKVRLVGGILPRYIYWIKGENDKNIPLECLAFDREKEAFTNAEKDWVREYFPDLKCSWAYSILCIDPDDGEVKVLNLKKKLLEQIMLAAEDLGDPTDPDAGWDVFFKKVKTGPLPYNVEYQFQPLKSKSRPLTQEERAAVATSKTIDDLLPRPSADAQKELLDRVLVGGGSTADKEIEDEFDVE